MQGRRRSSSAPAAAAPARPSRRRATGRRSGARPTAAIFLDDVTVSRKHAELVQRDGRWTIQDGGSLNGTFVNRKRVESAELEDGDEIQIGKYRLTFLQH